MATIETEAPTISIETSGRPATFTAYTLDKFISPGLSTFKEAEVKDLIEQYPEAQHWWANLTLNTIVSGPYPLEGMQQASLGFIRRTGSAFAAYHRAREITLEYLSRTQQGEQPLRKYYAAVDEWEVFVLQVQMALALICWLGEQNVFEQGDGSEEERIYTMANHIKHTDKCINSKQCTQSDTIPLWLSNNGLESFSVSLSFDEAASILAKLAETANEIQHPQQLIQTVREEVARRRGVGNDALSDSSEAPAR